MKSSSISINEVQLFKQSLGVEYLTHEECSRSVEELQQVLLHPDVSNSMKQWINIRLSRLDGQMHVHASWLKELEKQELEGVA